MLADRASPVHNSVYLFLACVELEPAIGESAFYFQLAAFLFLLLACVELCMWDRAKHFNVVLELCLEVWGGVGFGHFALQTDFGCQLLEFLSVTVLAVVIRVD